MSHPFLPPLDRPLVLASRSPRRASILESHGLEFEVRPAAVDERVLPGEIPEEHVSRLAQEKADAVADALPEALCLGCDTVVVVDGEILGKPEHAERAEAMLAALSGWEHVVYSAAALSCAASGYRRAGFQSTVVRFRELSEDEITRYVATGEPLDKAGSYGIQSYGSLLVESIDGCYFNVMGLPIGELRRLWLDYLARAGAANHSGQEPG